MSTQSEEALEDNLIKKLVSGGYEQVEIKDEKKLINNFKTQLEKFNETKFTDEEFKKIMTYLEGGSVFNKSKKLKISRI